MAFVLLTWKDNSTSEDSQRIYRSESPMDPDNLPPPIATVDRNVTSYADRNVIEGVTYFYRVSSHTPTFNAVSEEIVVTAEHGEFLPTEIGQEYDGGYYAGDIGYGGKNYKILVSGIDGEPLGTRRQQFSFFRATVSATNINDGMANTLAMNNPTFPAAMHCIDYRGGGHDDWYLPATNELLLVFNSFSPLSTTVDGFRAGEKHAFRAAQYWTSRQPFASDGSHVHMTSGAVGNDYKDTFLGVRPIRRIEFTP